jgi:hypothetical protein
MYTSVGKRPFPRFYTYLCMLLGAAFACAAPDLSPWMT